MEPLEIVACVAKGIATAFNLTRNAVPIRRNTFLSRTMYKLIRTNDKVVRDILKCQQEQTLEKMEYEKNRFALFIENFGGTFEDLKKDKEFNSILASWETLIMGILVRKVENPMTHCIGLHHAITFLRIKSEIAGRDVDTHRYTAGLLWGCFQFVFHSGFDYNGEVFCDTSKLTHSKRRKELVDFIRNLIKYYIQLYILFPGFPVEAVNNYTIVLNDMFKGMTNLVKDETPFIALVGWSYEYDHLVGELAGFRPKLQPGDMGTTPYRTLQQTLDGQMGIQNATRQKRLYAELHGVIYLHTAEGARTEEVEELEAEPGQTQLWSYKLLLHGVYKRRMETGTAGLFLCQAERVSGMGTILGLKKPVIMWLENPFFQYEIFTAVYQVNDSAGPGAANDDKQSRIPTAVVHAFHSFGHETFVFKNSQIVHFKQDGTLTHWFDSFHNVKTQIIGASRARLGATHTYTFYKLEELTGVSSDSKIIRETWNELACISKATYVNSASSVRLDHADSFVCGAVDSGRKTARFSNNDVFEAGGHGNIEFMAGWIDADGSEKAAAILTDGSVVNLEGKVKVGTIDMEQFKSKGRGTVRALVLGQEVLVACDNDIFVDGIKQ